MAVSWRVWLSAVTHSSVHSSVQLGPSTSWSTELGPSCHPPSPPCLLLLPITGRTQLPASSWTSTTNSPTTNSPSNPQTPSQVLQPLLQTSPPSSFLPQVSPLPPHPFTPLFANLCRYFSSCSQCHRVRNPISRAQMIFCPGFNSHKPMRDMSDRLPSLRIPQQR